MMRTSTTSIPYCCEGCAAGGGSEALQHIPGFDAGGCGGDQRFQIMRAERGGKAGPDDIVQPHLGRHRLADGLEETIRIVDLPGNVAVHHDVLFVAGEKFRGARIVDAQAPVEICGGLEEPLGVQAGVGHGAERLAELRHQHEFGFFDREGAEPDDDQRGECRRGGIVFLIAVHQDFPLEPG